MRKDERIKYGVMVGQEGDDIQTVCLEVSERTENDPLLMPLLMEYNVVGIGDDELLEKIGLQRYNGAPVDAYIGSNKNGGQVKARYRYNSMRELL